MKVFDNAGGRKKAHFLHIGKTGGSAVKSALMPYREASIYDIEFHGHNFPISSVPEGEKFFFFLRNPLTRFSSGFYSRKRKGLPRYNLEWSRLERVIFEKFNSPN